jgi:hypothetical protein
MKYLIALFFISMLVLATFGDGSSSQSESSQSDSTEVNNGENSEVSSSDDGININDYSVETVEDSVEDSDEDSDEDSNEEQKRRKRDDNTGVTADSLSVEHYSY